MSRRSMTRSAVGALYALGALIASFPSIADPMAKGDCDRPASKTDLRHCDLSGRKLAGADLRAVDLRG